ncbi:protein of unknown function [Halogranum gelatinilyticum]|uniref:DUF4382 domain-containing protein n=1 Tax=Halogranum gelatinilyticum TaxID=660521 RepID=A0A1G9P982_9EURY|nr:DUF4382 domain-containing protein [Halogranum gelatinilyticum]SDL95319.1 protein of unknown function [Halogranum gelatinilyticum]
MRRPIATVLVALMLLLAGCAGGVDSGTTGPSGETTAAESGSTSGSTGTVNMYVSDERNAIDQFEHLNVTITRVGFQKADADDEDDEESESESDENESEIEADDDVEIEANTTVNGSVDANTTGVNATADADVEANASGEFDESDGWEEYEVDSKTVDLTKLQGANASALSSIDVEEGNYSKVFVYVSDINGTLENGEQVNVKLPSQKLQLNKGFTIGANESVDFVYDITVFEAGNSGKYILKPVASESGTSDEVEIDVVDDEDDERDDDAEDAGNEADDAAEDADDAAEEAANGLNASFVSEVTAGSNATISVTQNGSAVANATVEVDGEVVGETDENGELTFSVPEGSEEIEVTVTSGDSEVELEQTLTATVEAGANAGNGNGNGNNGLTTLFG